MLVFSHSGEQRRRGKPNHPVNSRHLMNDSLKCLSSPLGVFYTRTVRLFRSSKINFKRCSCFGEFVSLLVC